MPWIYKSVYSSFVLGWQHPQQLCVTDTRYGYSDTGTAIREFEKRHSGSIERVSEYRSIEYVNIGYGYGWVSEVSVIDSAAMKGVRRAPIPLASGPAACSS